MDIEKQLKVIFSSDDNYAQHMGVSIKSLLEKNKGFGDIEIFVIDNAICDENKRKLLSIINEYVNVKITWIDFNQWKNKLQLNMAWKISISSYARLFIAEMVDESIDRILYMDCDMIVCESLRNLWITDLHGCVIGAVQDPVGNHVKAAVGLSETDRYFNAGMLLINLDGWRKQNIGGSCLDFINQKSGNVMHHDQGTLNGVLKGNVKFLHPKNNVMTIQYILNRDKQNKFFGNNAEYYCEDELSDARKNPVILHYTPSFTTRPWVKNCKHPLKYLYWEVLSYTPWKDYSPEKDSRKLHIRIVEWWYRNSI